MEKQTAAPKKSVKRKKTGGRTKGVKNKTTADLKNWVFAFVNENLGTFKKEFKNLKSDEQFNIIVKLMPYVLPKQTETKITVDDDLVKVVQESMDTINKMF